jgi:hypothetical protein
VIARDQIVYLQTSQGLCKHGEVKQYGVAVQQKCDMKFRVTYIVRVSPWQRRQVRNAGKSPRCSVSGAILRPAPVKRLVNKEGSADDRSLASVILNEYKFAKQCLKIECTPPLLHCWQMLGSLRANWGLSFCD